MEGRIFLCGRFIGRNTVVKSKVWLYYGMVGVKLLLLGVWFLWDEELDIESFILVILEELDVFVFVIVIKGYIFLFKDIFVVYICFLFLWTCKCFIGFGSYVELGYKGDWEMCFWFFREVNYRGVGVGVEGVFYIISYNWYFCISFLIWII